MKGISHMTQEDQILETIKEQKNNIENIIKKWTLLEYDKRVADLREEINSELFWKHPQQKEIAKEEKYLGTLQSTITTIQKSFDDIEQFIKEGELLDADLLKEIEKGLRTSSKEIKDLHITLLLNKPTDNKNCYLDINAGAGGTEAQDWALMLLRMYCRFCEHYKYKYSIINEIPGEGAGIKSATLFIEGAHIHGLLESENGIHRLVRISPFDANKKRHTSFAAVGIAPEIDDIEIKINPMDLRIDTFRAGGAGGQHVNKTDSAVRITHIPSNIVVQCQNERSQLQNKEQAMKMLKAKLYKKEEEERLQAFNAIERKKIEWGSQIRSYVLHPYKMVKDHRSELESSQPDKILDGEIMFFIEAYLLQRT